MKYCLIGKYKFLVVSIEERNFFSTVLRSGVVSSARGSAYIEMKRTKVTCGVYPYSQNSSDTFQSFVVHTKVTIKLTN